MLFLLWEEELCPKQQPASKELGKYSKPTTINHETKGIQHEKTSMVVLKIDIITPKMMQKPVDYEKFRPARNDDANGNGDPNDVPKSRGIFPRHRTNAQLIIPSKRN